MEKKKSKTRMLLVLAFIIMFTAISAISLRGDYLQYKELGENYIDTFLKGLNYKLVVFSVNFIILYTIIYLTNKGIKKGLKPFFEKDEKNMPKLLNKSIAFIMAATSSIVITKILVPKILVCSSNVAFGMADPIFNLDISFFMFQKPLIMALLTYFIILIVSITAYMTLYYIIVFNKYFNGIDGTLVRKSLLVKKILRNVKITAIAISIFILVNITGITSSKMLTIKNDTANAPNIDIVGAGYTEVIIQRWGYAIFSVIVAIAVIKAVKAFKRDEFSKVVRNLAIIPLYLVALFVVIISFDLIFVNSNRLDKEKEYLEHNIAYTKNAFNLNIKENNLENTGTITDKEVKENKNIIENIKIVDEDIVKKTLEDSQTETGYYSYKRANLAKYEILGKNKLVYVSPREISNSGKTYNNKTYEFTHGIGQIITSATTVSKTGNIEYIQKDISGKDNKLHIEQNNIYFGLETNNSIATKTKNKQEYDYTDENNIDHTSNYEGKAGLQLNLLDRIILGLKTGDLKLAFSPELSKESKILINRNIIKRAKKVMPYLIYDNNPYTVVTNEGKIIWVIDAYTVSNQYPYAQYATIEHDGIKEKINYMRNSVKVIIDSYDGTMKFYLTDKSDPIAVAYRNTFSTLFEQEEIQQDICDHLVYPEYLYNVQIELLKIYHNVKPDVLYRTDDIWDYAKYNKSTISKSTGNTLKPYYTMVKKDNKEEIGLIQIYTPEAKQNMISYLVGTTQGTNNELQLYKFSQDSDVLGPMQLDSQIEQDEMISKEIELLNTVGTRVTKEMVAVPIENTVLYVESIYQTMLNEESKIPMLKKILVASGNKLAIGNNLEEALNNLLYKEASNIEVDNTDDFYGVIDAVVKANKNLQESASNNDWELIGSDMQKLQELIKRLEELKKQEDKKREEIKNEKIIEQKEEKNIKENQD